MVSKEQLEQAAANQNILISKSLQDLTKIWNRISALDDPVMARDALLKMIPQFVRMYGSVASKLACEWYDLMRAESLDDVDGFSATMPVDDVVAPEQIRASIRWRADVLFGEHPDKDAMAQFLSSAVDRWIRQAYRGTIQHNGERDKKSNRYAIVPMGMCCAWCGMLASRDFVYHDDDAAKRSMHDHCDCQVVPSWGRKYDEAIIEGYDRKIYKQAYERAVAALDKPLSADAQLIVKQHVRGKKKQEAMKQTLKDINNSTASKNSNTITSIMRYTSPNLFTDGVYPDTERINDTTMSKWKEYRRDAFNRFLEQGSPRNGKLVPVVPSIAPPMPVDGPQLSDKQWNHILYGEVQYKKDEIIFEGGHFYGYGWVSGGSTFPKDWDEEKIYDALVQCIENGTSQIVKNNSRKYFAIIDGIPVSAYVDKHGISSFYPKER